MPKRIIRRPELEKIVGLKRSSIYEKLNPNSRYYDPTFPRSVRIGWRAVGWFLEDAEAWIKARVQRGDGDAGETNAVRDEG